MYSTREELELGYRYSIQLEKQLNINNDLILNQYINSLGQRLVQSSNRKNIPYTFKIVNDKSINAFAIPGGCLLYTSPSPRDPKTSRMPSSA